MNTTARLEGLREILDRLDISQSELARDLEKDRTTVHHWVKGQKVPHGTNLLAVLGYLQQRDPSVTLDDLLGRGAA